MNQEIKNLFNQIKHKQSFCIALANHLNQKRTSVTNKWFYASSGVPKEFQQVTIQKLKLQIKYDKICNDKVWLSKNN